jgi:hypothetical protein
MSLNKEKKSIFIVIVYNDGKQKLISGNILLVSFLLMLFLMKNKNIKLNGIWKIKNQKKKS